MLTSRSGEILHSGGLQSDRRKTARERRPLDLEAALCKNETLEVVAGVARLATRAIEVYFREGAPGGALWAGGAQVAVLDELQKLSGDGFTLWVFSTGNLPIPPGSSAFK